MKKLSLFLVGLFFIVLCSSQVVEATTLKQVVSYANDHKEFPKPNNTDVLALDYTTFYKENGAGFFGRTWNGLLRSLHLKGESFWSIEELKSLVAQMARDGNGKGEWIYKFTPKPQAKFVVWGDLQGAYHSLSQDLEKLKEQGVIDENLKIIKPDHYFVFNGNLLNRAPYRLETLKLVLTLMQKNNDKVFYVGGGDETKEFVINNELRKEIDIRAENLSEKDRNFLEEDMLKMFNLLPRALFLKVFNDKDFVCISHQSLGEGKLKQSYFAQFLKQEDVSGELQKFDLSQAQETDDFVDVDAIVKGLSQDVFYLPTTGLLQLPPDHGATAWRILSAPTTKYKEAYKFFYDAFAIVTAGKDIYNWKIACYNRDVRGKDDFQEKEYYLVSGSSTTLPPCTGKIVVGSTMALSGEARGQCKQVFQGLALRINLENRIGGINGKYIKFVVLNDGFDPVLAKKNVEDFLSKYKTDITLSSVGSPTLRGYLSFLRDDKILLLFPIAGFIPRTPDLANIVHFKASYIDEAKGLMEYAIDTLGVKKIAIFYRGDEGEVELLEAINSILSKNNIKTLLKVPYFKADFLKRKEDVNLSKDIERIKAFRPDTIMLYSTVAAAIELIKQLGVENLVNRKLLGFSELADTTFKNSLSEMGLKCTVARVVSDMNDSKLEIVKEYKKEATKKGYPISNFSLVAYIKASIFVDVIKGIQGQITKKKIIEKIEKIKNYNFKGLDLTFNSKTRSLNSDLWIDDGHKWVKWKIS